MNELTGTGDDDDDDDDYYYWYDDSHWSEYNMDDEVEVHLACPKIFRCYRA